MWSGAQGKVKELEGLWTNHFKLFFSSWQESVHCYHLLLC